MKEMEARHTPSLWLRGLVVIGKFLSPIASGLGLMAWTLSVVLIAWVLLRVKNVSLGFGLETSSLLQTALYCQIYFSPLIWVGTAILSPFKAHWTVLFGLASHLVLGYLVIRFISADGADIGGPFVVLGLALIEIIAGIFCSSAVLLSAWIARKRLSKTKITR